MTRAEKAALAFVNGMTTEQMLMFEDSPALDALCHELCVAESRHDASQTQDGRVIQLQCAPRARDAA